MQDVVFVRPRLFFFILSANVGILCFLLLPEWRAGAFRQVIFSVSGAGKELYPAFDSFGRCVSFSRVGVAISFDTRQLDGNDCDDCIRTSDCTTCRDRI
jgi:hypothetical protein